MNFKQLKLGDTAVVKGIQACSRSYRRRLMAMGIVPGIHLHIKRVAPFGDPMVVTFNGLTVALRRQEAALLDVELA